MLHIIQKKLMLQVSVHPEGPATGHLDTGFLGFPVIKQMQRWFPGSTLILILI
jgi:hypothetical protein